MNRPMLAAALLALCSLEGTEAVICGRPYQHPHELRIGRGGNDQSCLVKTIS